MGRRDFGGRTPCPTLDDVLNTRLSQALVPSLSTAVKRLYDILNMECDFRSAVDPDLFVMDPITHSILIRCFKRSKTN